MLSLFSSRETYRVHGAAHPSALKDRALALKMARLALAEQTLESKRKRVMSRTPAESQGPERDSVGIEHARTTGGRRSGDDVPTLTWRGDRVYFAGDGRGYRTLAEALAAWRGRAA